MKISDVVKTIAFAVMIVATASAQKGETAKGGDKIVFLTCSIVYDSIRQEYSMALVDKNVVDGKLKNYAMYGQGADDGEIIYQILDKDLKITHEKYLSCPLNKIIEYVDDKGNLQKKEIRSDNGQIFLRLQLTPEIQHVNFDRKGRKTRDVSQPLLTVDLEG